MIGKVVKSIIEVILVRIFTVLGLIGILAIIGTLFGSESTDENEAD